MLEELENRVTNWRFASVTKLNYWMSLMMSLPVAIIALTV